MASPTPDAKMSDKTEEKKTAPNHKKKVVEIAHIAKFGHRGVPHGGLKVLIC